MLLWTTRWLFPLAFRTSSRLTGDRERSWCVKATGYRRLRPQPSSGLSFLPTLLLNLLQESNPFSPGLPQAGAAFPTIPRPGGDVRRKISGQVAGIQVVTRTMAEGWGSWLRGKGKEDSQASLTKLRRSVWGGDSTPGTGLVCARLEQRSAGLREVQRALSSHSLSCCPLAGHWAPSMPTV